MSRSTPDSNINTAMGTITSNVASYLSNGGDADVLIRWMMAQLANTDQQVARAVIRAGVKPTRMRGLQGLTLAAADVRP